ncbi:hypothetical protein [Mycoplasma struthionis]|uniref:Uncharacterized protein n=1 Tax=Mycoplasma struthionis TaxID=538220 RepID=A0A3G8LGP1_9MOLU|nr:hypothetical protein [Mycoplasma struthionis]AZG68839.1 hypothetical protein EGN60_02660 [Mycoplasma struthionis]
MTVVAVKSADETPVPTLNGNLKAVATGVKTVLEDQLTPTTQLDAAIAKIDELKKLSAQMATPENMNLDSKLDLAVKAQVLFQEILKGVQDASQEISTDKPEILEAKKTEIKKIRESKKEVKSIKDSVTLPINSENITDNAGNAVLNAVLTSDPNIASALATLDELETVKNTKEELTKKDKTIKEKIQKAKDAIKSATSKLVDSSIKNIETAANPQLNNMTIKQYLEVVKKAVGNNEKGKKMIKEAEEDIKKLEAKKEMIATINGETDYKKQIAAASEVSKLFQKILKNLQDAAFAQ